MFYSLPRTLLLYLFGKAETYPRGAHLAWKIRLSWQCLQEQNALAYNTIRKKSFIRRRQLKLKVSYFAALKFKNRQCTGLKSEGPLVPALSKLAWFYQIFLLSKTGQLSLNFDKKNYIVKRNSLLQFSNIYVSIGILSSYGLLESYCPTQAHRDCSMHKREQTCSARHCMHYINLHGFTISWSPKTRVFEMNSK